MTTSTIRAQVAALVLLGLSTGTCFAQALLQKAEPPPPPPMAVDTDPAIEPQVTIRKKESETVAEYRINNRLYMIKVSRDDGLTYYLIDERGDGQFTRRDSLDSGLRVPMWVIKSW